MESISSLARLFRRLFLTSLETAFADGTLQFFANLMPLTDQKSLPNRLFVELKQASLLVYTKPPFGQLTKILAYLARYTHRATIANSQLVSIENANVAFKFKDYQHSNQRKIMRLDAHDLIYCFPLEKIIKTISYPKQNSAKSSFEQGGKSSRWLRT